MCTRSDRTDWSRKRATLENDKLEGLIRLFQRQWDNRERRPVPG
jgi:hypothetical protein